MTHEYERTEGISRVTEDPSGTVLNVVFVHGLNGGAFSTWNCEERASLGFWPGSVAKDHPRCCVWTVHYTARILEPPLARSSSMDLLNRAAWLAEMLVLNEIPAKPVVFVAHSLGGLLVKQALQFSQSLGRPEWRATWEQTQAVLFLATPHTGSGLSDAATALADVARRAHPLTWLFLRQSPALANLKKDNPILKYLGDWYRDHAPVQGIQTIAFAEGKKRGGAAKVVSETSANPQVANVSAVVLAEEDHGSIAKPRHKRSAVSMSLDKCLCDVERRASLLGPGGTPLPSPLDQTTIARLAENRRLIAGISGAWWEHTSIDKVDRISFFRMVPDMLFNSVSLDDGKSYDNAGNLVAKWWSVIARVEKVQNKVVLCYLWKGEHVDPKIANVPFHGFGSAEFAACAESGDAITHGEGKFWEVDEFHPKNTVLKPKVELRRVAGPDQVLTMTRGTESAIKELVTTTLANWGK